MAKLIDKLNVLVRSSVKGALGSSPAWRTRRGGDLEQEAAALRERINQALDDEDRQLASIEALKQQIDDWDQQADQALTKGDEATARHAIRQMQLLQRRKTMLEADLTQHRRSTGELISQVNELEAIVAEAVRQADAQPQDDESREETLMARMQRVRQQMSVPQPPAARQHDEPPSHEVDEQAIEDDLARRRARLSQ